MNKNQDENKIIAIIVLVSGHFRIFICYFSETNPQTSKLAMKPEEGISPWRNAKPRKPLDAFPSSPSVKTSPVTGKRPGESPPNSGYKESTRMGNSLEQSSSSVHESSQLELSSASPALPRSDERGGSKQRTNKISNFTKIRQEVKNKSKTRKTKSKYSDEEMTDDDDDQPSGTCYYVGEKGNLSISSSVNRTMSRSRSSPDVTPPPPSKGSSVCACVWVVTLVSLLMVGTAVLQDSEPDTSSSGLHSSAEHWREVRRSVSAELASLKILFPNQTKSSWRVIGATVKAPLHPLPDYPGVLLLVSPSLQSGLATCLASKLIETSSRVLLSPGLPSPPTEDLLIRAAEFSALDPDTAKRQLTDRLHASLHSFNTAAVISLDSLHPTAALTLHAFADNSNAPYKQAVIVLTLTGDLETEQTGDCKLETRVEKLLAGLWRDQLGVDKFSALISRIVVSTVELQPESLDICV